MTTKQIENKRAAAAAKYDIALKLRALLDAELAKLPADRRADVEDEVIELLCEE